MSTIERRYNRLGVAAAIALGVLILGYRLLTSEAQAPFQAANDRANHHPRDAAAAAATR